MGMRQLIVHHLFKSPQQRGESVGLRFQDAQRRDHRFQGRERTVVWLASNTVVARCEGSKAISWQLVKARQIANDRLRLMPCSIDHDQLFRPIALWQGREFRGAGIGKQQTRILL